MTHFNILSRYQKTLLWIIFILSLGATVGSLYYGWYGDPIANMQTGDLFNPANGFPPCERCWYARVFQYPIVLLSGLGLYFHDKTVAMRYILPLAILGLTTNIYNWLIESQIISPQATCTLGSVPCGIKYVEYFGFLTLPLMGAIIFILTIICVILFHQSNNKQQGSKNINQ